MKREQKELSLWRASRDNKEKNFFLRLWLEITIIVVCSVLPPKVFHFFSHFAPQNFILQEATRAIRACSSNSNSRSHLSKIKKHDILCMTMAVCVCAFREHPLDYLNKKEKGNLSLR
jgi:hypothetical protein